MNKDQLEGNWKRLKGEAKERWGELTDDDLDRIEGKWDKLVGRIQERYGIAREEAEAQLEEWRSTEPSERTREGRERV